MSVATVIVTGGAGYVGSHACKALARAGYLPVTYDDLSHGHRWAVRWGPLETGTIFDAARLSALIRRYKPIALMHFAGLIAAGESVTDPAKYHWHNVTGLLCVLDAMRDAGLGRIVFSSSAAVYGAPVRTPMDEDHPIHPVSPYGATKAMGERILADFAAAYGIRSVSLRYFNAAGADADGEIGEAHAPETHLIPLVLAAARNQTPVSIFGSSYPTRDGTCVRDYIHVSDLADAHVLSMRFMEEAIGAHVYNLGNGRGYTVREVIDAARAVTGMPILERLSDPRPGDPPELLADAALARSVLGWRPMREDLDTQLRHAWQWACMTPETRIAAR